MILNVLRDSKFWHVAKVLSSPNWVSVENKRAVWPFIWKSKSETVSRARCVAPIERGGLNIVDFETQVFKFAFVESLWVLGGIRHMQMALFSSLLFRKPLF